MIDEKRNEIPRTSTAFSHGVRQLTPLNAIPTVRAASAFTAAMRAQNVRVPIMTI